MSSQNSMPLTIVAAAVILAGAIMIAGIQLQSSFREGSQGIGSSIFQAAEISREIPDQQPSGAGDRNAEIRFIDDPAAKYPGVEDYAQLYWFIDYDDRSMTLIGVRSALNNQGEPMIFREIIDTLPLEPPQS